jgi:serine protease Do
MAEALHVPQARGLLVKQVVKESIGGQIGLRGGNRVGIVDGQHIVVGGDVVLSVQGIAVPATRTSPRCSSHSKVSSRARSCA